MISRDDYEYYFACIEKCEHDRKEVWKIVFETFSHKVALDWVEAMPNKRYYHPVYCKMQEYRKKRSYKFGYYLGRAIYKLERWIKSLWSKKNV